jgi:FkbM family methyltransferase
LGVYDLYPNDLATLDRDYLEETVQRRTQTVYLGSGVVLARILTRYKMLLHTSDRGFACHVMMDGYWEIWITQFFARMMKPGMRILDVGANYGYYTMLFADIAGPEGRVIAVEPNPAAAELLRQSLLLNGFHNTASVVEAGLSASPADGLSLVVPASEPKNAYLAAYPADGVGVLSVALTTGDEIARELDRVDFIKIDAEGSEEAIIAGMQTILRRDRPGLVLEFNNERCRDPAGLLDGLIEIYGGIYVVGHQGNAEPIDRETVLTTQSGVDWMLFFSRQSA